MSLSAKALQPSADPFLCLSCLWSHIAPVGILRCLWQELCILPVPMGLSSPSEGGGDCAKPSPQVLSARLWVTGMGDPSCSPCHKGECPSLGQAESRGCDHLHPPWLSPPEMVSLGLQTLPCLAAGAFNATCICQSSLQDICPLNPCLYNFLTPSCQKYPLSLA